MDLQHKISLQIALTVFQFDLYAPSTIASGNSLMDQAIAKNREKIKLKCVNYSSEVHHLLFE